MRLKVLWVSGWGFSAESFYPIANRLSDSRERQGTSVDNWFFDWALGDTQNALLFALKTALVKVQQESEEQESKQQSRKVVVAWSLGALAVLSLGSTFLNTYDALVIVGGTPRFLRSTDWPHGWDKRVLERFRQQLMRQPEKTFRRFLHDIFEEIPSSFEYIALPIADPIVYSSAIAGLALLERLDARESLLGLRLPIYILHGMKDTIIPVTAAFALRERLSNGSLTLWEGAGHAPHLEYPEDFSAWLDISLREVIDWDEGI